MGRRYFISPPMQEALNSYNTQDPTSLLCASHASREQQQIKAYPPYSIHTTTSPSNSSTEASTLLNNQETESSTKPRAIPYLGRQKKRKKKERYIEKEIREEHTQMSRTFRE